MDCSLSKIQPYEFKGEEEGLLVYQNGDRQIKINPTTHVITHTISDEQIQNGSELIIHYQEQPYEFKGEEEGLLVYQNGDGQIKI